jgi:chromosome partitioning protein
MQARLVTVSNAKGGVGKSTLALNVSAALCSLRKKVLVVDADPQGTATQWVRSAPAAKPFPAAVVGLAHAGSKLHQLLQPHVDNYDYILVDCPPSVDELATQSALLVSDLCLIPMQATPADLWATQSIAELISRARVLNPELKAFAVANRVTRSRLGRQVLTVMREGEIQLLDAVLGNRTSFQLAAVRGSAPSMMGAAHKLAAAEVDAVVLELLARMEWQ